MKNYEQISKELKHQEELIKKVVKQEDRIRVIERIVTLKWVLEY